jgi:hypothetical protein
MKSMSGKENRLRRRGGNRHAENWIQEHTLDVVKEPRSILIRDSRGGLGKATVS